MCSSSLEVELVLLHLQILLSQDPLLPQACGVHVDGGIGVVITCLQIF